MIIQSLQFEDYRNLSNDIIIPQIIAITFKES